MSDLFGSMSFYVPSYPKDGEVQSGITQNYLNDYEYTPTTGYTSFSYIGIGTSRLSELKKYGTTGYTQTLTSGSMSDGVLYTGYTFTYSGKTGTTTTLQYFDRFDGFTQITGNTTGFTKEEVFNYALTRNEHFLGFVEQPTVFSDIFVERGKQGVMERNFRLSEVDSMGELSVYGNGYFKVRKQ